MSYPRGTFEQMFEEGQSSIRSIRQAIERLGSEDVAQIGDAQLTGQIVGMERAQRALEAERLRRVAELDRRKRVHDAAPRAAATWLAGALGTGMGKAIADVRLGRALESMPATAAALAAGELSPGAVRVLVHARQENPGRFDAAEASLIGSATTASPQELGQIVRRWAEEESPSGSVDRAERMRRRRHLRVWPDPYGMIRVDGELDPENGEAFGTALRAIRDADARSSAGNDGRTNDQRMADAAGELARQWLDRVDRPTVAGERPHVTVTVGLDALRESAGSACHLAVGGAAPAAVARRLACDAAVIPAVLNGRSEPLDVGRKSPVVPPAIRRAVVLRDRHCRYPGCDRPQAWCDAHHVVHWADGGRTDLSNLVLLCRPHHREVHEGLARIDATGEGPAVRARNGTPDAEIVPAGRAPP